MADAEEVACIGCRGLFTRKKSPINRGKVAAALGAARSEPFCEQCAAVSKIPTEGAEVTDDEPPVAPSRGFSG